jgi:uncharacterized membrane protein YfcA
MIIETFLIIIAAAFIMEAIDSGFGMGYGTVLSPILINFGYPPLVVVPSVLLSQAIGGFTASMFHQRFGNVNFRPQTTDVSRIRAALARLGYITCFKLGFTRDFKIALAITSFGILATIVGAFVAVGISKTALTWYIGILVFLIGLLMLSGKTFKFSWLKMMGLGVLAAFNKGISGGGFGPVVTGGQVIAGNKHKNSIGCTTLAEAPICITGFIVYMLTKGLASYDALIALCIGAFLGAIAGPFLTHMISARKLKFILGASITIIGAWTVIKLLI